MIREIYADHTDSLTKRCNLNVSVYVVYRGHNM